MTNKLYCLFLIAALAGCGGGNKGHGNDDMGGTGGNCDPANACASEGATRCADVNDQETCAMQGGCLQWVKSACSGAQICMDPGDGSGARCLTGVPCTCPSGYSCDAQGVCVGGDGTKIGIDVKTVSVSGVITLNGAAPSTLPSCNNSPSTAKATVHLSDAARGYAFDLPVTCSSATFEWSGVVFPGTYTVTVNGDSNYSSLPEQAFVANPALTVSADVQNLALDVKTASVGGTVKLNGATPMTLPACSGNDNTAKAVVHLSDKTNGYVFNLDVPCSAADFSWGGVIFPGTYAVSVTGDPSYTDLPAAPFVANPALAVSGNVGNQALAVKTVAVSGSITLNGVAPTASCPAADPGYSKATVRLTDAKQGYAFTLPVTCAEADFSWSGAVYPGTYAVSVDSGNGYSNLPDTAYVANPSLAIKDKTANQVLDVKTVSIDGTVTLNGAAPAPTNYCASSPSSVQATVQLEDAKDGYRFSFTIPCSSATLAWTGVVFPGHYRVSVTGQPYYSTLPPSPFVARDDLAVSGDTGNVALDVKTASVSGTLTLNGIPPTTSPTCANYPDQTKATVRLTNAKLGYSFELPVPCSSSTFAFSGDVFPGTYTATVTGGDYSNLPSQPFVANTALTVSGATSGQVLDVKTVPVGGTIALNGAPPATTTYCNPSPTATKATVSFVDTTSGYDFSVPIACSSASFAWSGVVYPGTYRISVAGANGYSNLPTEGYLVTPRLKLP